MKNVRTAGVNDPKGLTGAAGASATTVSGSLTCACSKGDWPASKLEPAGASKAETELWAGISNAEIGAAGCSKADGAETLDSTGAGASKAGTAAGASNPEGCCENEELKAPESNELGTSGFAENEATESILGTSGLEIEISTG